MRSLLIIAALPLGCSHIYQKHTVVMRSEQVSTDHELICYALDNKQVAWGAVGVAASALAGGSSTLMAIFDDRTMQYSLAGGSVAFTVLAAVSAYFQNHYVKQYSDQCTK